MADSQDSMADQAEALSQKHKKEKKELQAQIQKLKHSVPKGDKKKKKEITDQISKLEADLNLKHAEELKNVELHISQVADRLENVSVDETTKEEEETDQTLASSKDKKPSKAGKRREKKAKKEKERQDRIKEQDIVNLSGVRNLEFQQIKTVLKQRNLQVFEIPSDGNCLYNAVCHQLLSQGLTENNDSLRAKVARFMRDNPDDFLPFLSKDNGDLYSLEDFEQYCTELATTSAWGGHLEIKALSHVLQQPIEILQSEGPEIKLGEEFEKQGLKPITLTYHRHAYGLGEHYNSVDTYNVNDELSDKDQEHDNI